MEYPAITLMSEYYNKGLTLNDLTKSEKREVINKIKALK